MEKDAKIYVAGHEGMVGSTLYSELKNRGYKNLLSKSFQQLDLRKQADTNDFIHFSRPDYIFLIAGKVGGINSNIQYPGEYLYDNMMIAANVLEAARQNHVKKLLFLGSSCIYPRECNQPMKEEYLLTGKLEPTNEGYALGKIAGIKLCEYYRKQYRCNYISVIPPNLYGPKDNFSLEHSHVISALLNKFDDAKLHTEHQVEIWGTGIARREFLFTEDLIDGLIFLMKKYDGLDPINIGSGKDVSIKELVSILKDVVGYEGEIIWDSTKPDGMPRKLMDSSRINKLGWSAKTTFVEGLKKTYDWYINQQRNK